MNALLDHYRRKAEQDRLRMAEQLRREFWARKQKEAKDADERF